MEAATYMKKMRKHVGSNGMVKKMKGKNQVSGRRTAYKPKVAEIMCKQRTFGCSSLYHAVAFPAIPPHLDRDDYRSEGSERGGARKRAKLSLR